MGVPEDKALLDRIEADIEKLKVAYDMYFQGMEKRPPLEERRRLDREVNRLIGFRSPNTAVKFRANTVVQRMVTYRHLWDRIMQQIEDGRFKRDIFKANLKHQRPPAPRGTRDEIIEDAELVEDAPQRQWGGVFDAYVKARQSTQEGTGGLSYDKMAAVLEKQAAQLRAKYNARDVEFKVVVEGGKTKLKAVPKK